MADSLRGDTLRESGKQTDVEKDVLLIEANHLHVLVQHLKNVYVGPIFFRFLYS